MSILVVNRETPNYYWIKLNNYIIGYGIFLIQNNYLLTTEGKLVSGHIIDGDYITTESIYLENLTFFLPVLDYSGNVYEVIRTKTYSGYEMSSTFLEIDKNKYVFNNPKIFKARDYYLISCISFTKPDAILFCSNSYIYTKQVIIPSYKKLADIYKQILNLEIDKKRFLIKYDENFLNESKKIYKLIKKLKWWAI